MYRSCTLEFLTPITAAIAAGMAVPLLVAMYFLRLKRRQVVVSSTLLWQRAVRDLQVNAPFQRLRKNLLLLLQLLAMLAVLLALAGPMLSLQLGPARRVVLLIDRSASMSSRENDTPRLELARRQARTIIESLRTKVGLSLGDESDQAMVIAFDEHPKVMCNFTADKRKLAAAVDAISPGDGGTSLAEALKIAQAFASSPGVDANNRSATTPAQVELFSDGRIRDTADVLASSGEIRFHCVGEGTDNVAVVAMDARRLYDKPEQVNVFASLANYSDSEAACDVQLSVDGNIRSVQSVKVPARRKSAGPETPGTGSNFANNAKLEPVPPNDAKLVPVAPGKLNVNFTLVHSKAAVLEVRQLRADQLAADDAAWVVIPPPRKLTVMLVTRGNPALSAALGACPLARLDVVSPDQFARMDKPAMAAEGTFDLIVLDNVGTAASQPQPATAAGKTPGTGTDFAKDAKSVPVPNLPRGRYLVFGPPPPESGVTSAGVIKNQSVADWRGRHPVLQHINLTNLYAGSAVKLALPREATMLAEFEGGPCIALANRSGSTFLLVGFDVMETNWPFEASFVMFCYNAVKYLGLEVGQLQQRSLKVGEAITVQGTPGDRSANVRDPAGGQTELAPDGSGAFRYPATVRAGVYEVTVAGRPTIPFAVNILDESESDILPAREISMPGQTVKAQDSVVGRTNRELWPLLVLICLAMVCLEWLVYNSRIRL